MQTQRVNRTDPEKVFLVVKNVDADSITTGMGVRLIGGIAAEIASTDGIASIKLAAGATGDATMAQFAGIAVEDIPSNGFGRVQAWGLVNSTLLSAEANKTVGVTGIALSFLKVGAVAGSFTSTRTPQSLSTYAYKYIQALTTTNISGGLNYTKAYVRAL